VNDQSVVRSAMVDEQIAARGVRDQRVLAAMRAVPRHRFVPDAHQHHAYEDHPLPIGDGQTISQPYIVAAMTEALDVGPGHRVLEVGTGSGYQAAVLARLAATVYTVELVERLSAAARRTLAALGVNNVRFRVGDGHVGWPEQAPFDRVMVTAGADVMPQGLVGQLADGGKIVVPIASGGGQVLTLGVKHGARLVQRPLMAVAFVPFVRPRR
jgi:protein-L-isoaspartate(D-aspartate) O-methyltransferase